MTDSLLHAARYVAKNNDTLMQYSRWTLVGMSLVGIRSGSADRPISSITLEILSHDTSLCHSGSATPRTLHASLESTTS